MNKKEIINKAKSVLEKWRSNKLKAGNESGLKSPQLTAAPNHQTVIESNQDKPILRNLKYKSFCNECERANDYIRDNGGKQSAEILKMKYFQLDHISDFKIYDKLGITMNDFYHVRLPRAQYKFGVVCNLVK